MTQPEPPPDKPLSLVEEWRATSKPARPYYIASACGLIAYIAVFCFAPLAYVVPGMSVSCVIFILGLIIAEVKSTPNQGPQTPRRHAVSATPDRQVPTTARLRDMVDDGHLVDMGPRETSFRTWFGLEPHWVHNDPRTQLHHLQSYTFMVTGTMMAILGLVIAGSSDGPDQMATFGRFIFQISVGVILMVVGGFIAWKGHKLLKQCCPSKFVE